MLTFLVPYIPRTPPRALLHIARRLLNPPPASSASSSSEKDKGKRKPVDVTRIHVIYVDDSALYPCDEGGARDLTEDVRAIVEEEGGAAAGLDFVPIKFEDLFQGQGEGEQLVLAAGLGEEAGCTSTSTSQIRATRSSSSSSVSSPSPLTSLRRLFSTLSPHSTSPRSLQPATRTRLETLHHSLLQHLLRHTATRLGCSTLLLGESATRSSIRLLSTLSTGGGHKWPVEGSEAIWVDEVLVLRPLRETGGKEIAYYVRERGLTCLEPRSLLGPGGSIGGLTRDFLLSLEAGVPSTVSTVGRTGGKLVLKEEGSVQSLGETMIPYASSQQGGGWDERVAGRSGVGQKGDRLMATVLTQTQRWTWRAGIVSANANANSTRVVLPCPLCGLPAQQEAGRWREKITIRRRTGTRGEEAGSGKTDRASTDARRETFELDEMLCYPCLSLFLDAATANKGDNAGLVLPSHVGRIVEERLCYERAEQPTMTTNRGGSKSVQATGQDEVGDQLDLDAAADGGRRQMAAAAPGVSANGAGGGEHTDGHSQGARDEESVAILRRHATRRLDRSAMQGKIGGYLLEEDE